MDSWIGRTLSKVEIQERLGRGGMAEVYLGRHTTLDRPVAVKILQAHLQEEEELKRRFLAEAQAVAGLRHPNIVQVFDYDLADDRPYIVMELLPGQSLAEYMTGLHRTGLTLPLPTVSRLLKKLAGALDYAHQRGIIHRDVKPANIMLRQASGEIDPSVPLSPDVEPILTDFGVARFTNATTQTATGTVIGTPAYMSPEQVRGADIDSRSDIYSLGIVLYELLSGKPPFNHETTPAAVLVKHLNEQPPAVPQASPGVQAVVRKALAKDPDARFQKAGELAAALEAESSATIPPSAAGSKAGTAQSQEKRSPPLACWGVAALAALGLIVVLAIGGVFGLSRLRANQATQPTTSSAAGAATEPANTATADAAVAVSPTATPAESSEPLGTALLQANSLTLQLDGVPAPPQGFAYHIWLRTTDEQLLSLGPAQQDGGQLSFSHQSENPLDSRAAAIMISLEPEPDPDPGSAGEVQFQGSFPPEVLERLTLLQEETGPGAPVSLVPQGLGRQVVHFNSHLGFALQGIEANSLAQAKLHAEHVINIVDGRSGPDYADWNGDGRVENPGDDVGLLPYLALLNELLAGGQGLAPDQAAREAQTAASDRVAELAEQAEQVRDLGTRIAAADTITEIQPLADELRSYELAAGIEALLAQAEDLQLALVIPISAATP